jgi:hypothetical protein
MFTSNFTGKMAIAAIQTSVRKLQVSPSDVDPNLGDRIVPLDLRQWLARLRLLEGVPFAYLVADSLLLPPESIRFFYVDRNWTDALIQGALSAGTANSADRAQLEQLHAPIRNEIDEEERLVRMPGGEEVQKGPAGTITGFLLRSRAVSGWPGMHVRAYRREVGKDNEIIPESHPDRIKVLRLERLAPAVLLALFDGVPAVVHLEEPRHGLQFGVRLAQSGGTNQFNAFVVARDAQTSDDVKPETDVPVTFRRGSPGVLDLTRTANALIGTAATHTGPALDGAEFALEMIRFPYRQVFGDTSLGGVSHLADVFRPSLSVANLRTKFLETIK